MKQVEPIQFEREPEPPLRAENDDEGSCFIRGYVDALQDRGLKPPKRHTLAYYRGFVQGLQARYRESQSV